jgi:hypothetical protein
MNGTRDPIMATIDRLIEDYMGRSKGRLPDPDWLTKELFTNYREVVDGYLTQKLEQIVRNYAVVKRLGAKRATLVRQVQRSVISGSKVDDNIMYMPIYVPNVGWRTVGKMTGDDHHKVALAYQGVADTLHKRAALHEELAQEVGDRTTEEAFSAEQLVARVRPAYKDDDLTPIGVGR